MARTWNLLVRADGDTRAAQKELRGLQRSARNVGRNLTSMGRSLTLSVTAPILAMAGLGISELMETRAVTMKTDAVFKSMGDTMKVTRGQFDQLVDRLSDYSGLEGDIVQGNANVALSFKALASNPQLFEDTMKAALDMSAALGIDSQTAVVQLGKAMQNGAKGAGALAKNGTLAKDDIAKLQAMAKAGVPLWKQQEFILKAVNKQYAGQGKNVNPLITIRNAVKDLAESMASLLLPSIMWVSKRFQELARWSEGLSSGQRKVLGVVLALAAALGPLLLIGGQMAMAWAALLPILSAVAVALGTSIAVVLAVAAGVGVLVGALVYAYVKSETFRTTVNNAFKSVAAGARKLLGEARLTITTWIGWAQGAWRRWGSDITRVASAAWRAIVPIISNALKIVKSYISTILAVLRGDWKGAWDGIKGIASGAWGLIKAVVSAGGKAIVAILGAAWNVLKAGAKAAWAGIKSSAASGIASVITTLRSLPGKISALNGAMVSGARAIGSAIISGIMSALRAGSDQIVSYVAGLGGRALNAIKAKLHIKSPSRVFAREVGEPIIDGIGVGIASAEPRMRRRVKETVGRAVKDAQRLARSIELMNIGQSFATSLLGLNLAKAGSSNTIGGMQQQIKLMQSQYSQLSAFLSKNGKKLGKEAKQQIMDQMTGLLSGIESMNQSIADAGKQALDNAKAVADEIKNGIIAAGNALNEAFDLQKAQAELAEALTGTDSSARLREIARAQYEALKGYYDANQGSFTDGERASVIRQMIDALQASKAATVAVSSGDSSGVSVPQIPRFARGGIAYGRTLAEVGEYSGVRGDPEVIAPLSKLRELMGPTGNVEVHVHPQSGDPEAIARRVAQILNSTRARTAGAF